MNWIKLCGLTLALAAALAVSACMNVMPAGAPPPPPPPKGTSTPLPTLAPSRTPARSSTPVSLPTKTPRPNDAQYARKPTPTPVALPTATPTIPSIATATRAPAKPKPTRPTAKPGTASTSAPAAPAPAGAGRIAFAMGRGNETDIALLDVASGAISVVATNGRQPDMRSDGVIVFNGEGGGRDNLFTVMSDGQYLTEIGIHAEDNYPQWMPTKPWIVYGGTFEGDDRVFVQADTSGPQPNILPQRVDIHGGPLPIQGRYPTWLPNGRIVFTGCDIWTRAGSCGMWTIYANKYENFVPFRLNDDTQARSNDSFGESLVWSSPSSGNWEVYLASAALPSKRGNPTPVPYNLTNNPAQDAAATFSPDGKQVAFISDRGGGWGIWTMGADGRNPRLLAAVPGGFGPRWNEERLSWGR
jgi:Tol biopolymer transport system component